MEIKHKNDETCGVFIAKNGEEVLGEMSYIWLNADKFAIDHTGVDTQYRGQGVAKELLMKAVNYARANGLKIRPLCSYALASFDAMPEISDVRA